MIGGPQIAKLVHEFEEALYPSSHEQSNHHDQVPSFQTKFKSPVQNMVDTIAELGNPILHDSKEVMSLSSKDVADVSIATTINEIEKNWLTAVPKIHKGEAHRWLIDQLVGLSIKKVR